VRAAVPSQGAQGADATLAPAKGDRMRLRYGLNIGDHWRDPECALAREQLITRIKDAGTTLVRVFPGIGGRSSADDWAESAAFFDAILRTGATPMIAFPCPQAWNDSGAVRMFSRQCCELVDRSIERFGQREVASWFWSIGDEPNSPWTNGGLTFEGYRDIYQMTAQAIQQRLGSPVGRPRIGGPCVDGFQPFWFDWIWRFVEEVDDSLIGFVAWNRYGDWREPGAWSAPSDPKVFERLLLSRTGEYWSRAQAVGVLLEGRGILNLCSELNAHAHQDPAISSRFNQGPFGAAYYGSALIDLMRGGADGEFLWAGACDRGPYGALDVVGRSTPTYEAKKLIARNVRFGDVISFPLDRDPVPDFDAVVASDEAGRRVAVLVYLGSGGRKLELDRWPELAGFSQVTSVGSNAGQQRSDPLPGAVAFGACGVALLHHQRDV
jgi:Glycosyl hydrolases family 39